MAIFLTNCQDDATMNLEIRHRHMSANEKALGSDDPRAFSCTLMIGAPRWCHNGCAYYSPSICKISVPRMLPRILISSSSRKLELGIVVNLPPLPY